MISVEAARARILAGLVPVAAESVALSAAHGRVLAAPVLARLSAPPANVSAMDGYAVRAAEARAGAELRVTGEAPAGRPFTGVVGPGEAVRIFTGSMVPPGADAVLIQENATAAGGRVRVNEAVTAGRYIRRAGQDFQAGEEVLATGRRLSVRDIGLAAAAGYPWLSVRRRPRLAILCTGDEIALPGEPLPPGGIANANGAMLAAFITARGGEPLLLPAIPDEAAAVAQAVEAARGADMLVITGGASVGAHDVVQEGLGRRGFSLAFWKIAMRPGKPLIFGRAAEMPVLGLPGNPVSAYVCARLFLEGALAALSGSPPAPPRLETAILGAALKANDEREDYLRAGLAWDGQGWVATPLPLQDSAMLRGLAGAGALIRRAPRAAAAAPGDRVEILRLDER